jgi:gliding motility-associatede transport system auxiliary component
MTTDTQPAGGLATFIQFRRQIAIGLVAVGVILTVITIWWGIWGWPTRDDPSKAAAPEVKAGEELPPHEPPKPEAKPRAHSVDYLPAAVWAGLLAVLCFGSAVWLLTQPLPAGAEASGVRTEVLTFGSIFGLLTAILGLLLGIRWHESLFRWVNEDKIGEARWILIAACIFTAGLIFMFASLQLARAEERANVTLRRVLYGFNAVFLGLLLVMVLIAVNVFSFLKVPSTLVTTEAAFTGLTDPSKTFLRSLDQPVRVYLILPEKHEERVRTMQGVLPYRQLYNDCRGLLIQCEDYSPHFKATYLSPALDSGRIAGLVEQYNIKLDEPGKEPTGMLVTAGEGGEASSFISSADLVETAMIGRQSEGIIFQGENRLLTELAYLTDKRSKEVVYFTQDHGELSVEPSGAGNRSANGVVQGLRDKKVRVEALQLDPKAPKVPADAAVVVVAGPQQTISPESPTYKALRAYMRPDDPTKDRPGKLVAFLPAFPTVERRVAPTGLESLLAEFGVQVTADRRLVGVRGQHPVGAGRYVPPDTAYCAPYGDLRLKLANTFPAPILMRYARPIRSNPGPGGFQTHLVLGTPRRAQYWLQADFTTQPETILSNLLEDKDGKVHAEMQFTNQSVPVAVAVTEGGASADPKKGDKPRLIVFGSDTPIQDRPEGGLALPEEYRQLIFSDCVDWAREREASLGIPPRKTSTYTIGKQPEWSSLLTLLAIMMVGITGLGVGVWLSRRR